MHSIDEDFEVGSYSLLHIESLWMQFVERYPDIESLRIFSNGLHIINQAILTTEDHVRLRGAITMLQDEHGRTWDKFSKKRWEVICKHIEKDLDTVEMIKDE